jgi:hypothetical protein
MSDEGKLIPPEHNPAEEAFEFGAAESLQAYDLTDGMYEYPHMPTMFQHVAEEVCFASYPLLWENADVWAWVDDRERHTACLHARANRRTGTIDDGGDYGEEVSR